MRMKRLKVRLSERERKESASSGKLVNSLLWMMVLMTMGGDEKVHRYFYCLYW